jgi:RNA polymerase sigma-70 factor (ECF subfamily)
MILLYLLKNQQEYSKKNFEQIYELYKGYVYQICNSVLNDPYLAEDAMQESFINIARNVNKIDLAQEQRTKYLIRIIARNKAIDIYRRNKHTPYPIEDIETNVLLFSPEPDLRMVQDETIREIAETITALPYDYREIIELIAYYELSYREIADLLHISYNAVKIRIHKARKLLKSGLKAKGIHVK